MSARLIRDDMLDSERVQTLPIEARWLYMTILLTADDVGLFEVSAFKLGRRAGLDQQKVPVLIQLLADSDLIRIYEADGKRFAFIPRFKQRLQATRSKHPTPPTCLIADDKHAINQINDLAQKARGKTVAHGDSPPELEPELEEEKAPTVLVRRKASNASFRVEDCPYEKLLGLYHEALPSLPRMVVLNGPRRDSMRARWRDVCGAERFDTSAGTAWFADFFRGVGKSRFLMGRAPPGRDGRTFKADLEWLLKPGNFAKVVEGRYHGETA